MVASSNFERKRYLTRSYTSSLLKRTTYDKRYNYRPLFLGGCQWCRKLKSRKETIVICQSICYNQNASRKSNFTHFDASSPGDVRLRQVIRLKNCRSRCRYALSLNNRQNISCQRSSTESRRSQRFPRSQSAEACIFAGFRSRLRCLRSSDETSAHPLPVGLVPGDIHVGCDNVDRLLSVI